MMNIMYIIYGTIVGGLAALGLIMGSSFFDGFIPAIIGLIAGAVGGAIIVVWFWTR